MTQFLPTDAVETCILNSPGGVSAPPNKDATGGLSLELARIFFAEMFGHTDGQRDLAAEVMMYGDLEDRNTAAKWQEMRRREAE